MVITLDWIVLFLALICFLASTAGIASRVNLQSLGLALWVLTLLF
jgi:hypothetical protein